MPIYTIRQKFRSKLMFPLTRLFLLERPTNIQMLDMIILSQPPFSVFYVLFYGTVSSSSLNHLFMKPFWYLWLLTFSPILSSSYLFPCLSYLFFLTSTTNALIQSMVTFCLDYCSIFHTSLLLASPSILICMAHQAKCVFECRVLYSAILCFQKIPPCLQTP